MLEFNGIEGCLQMTDDIRQGRRDIEHFMLDVNNRIAVLVTNSIMSLTWRIRTMKQMRKNIFGVERMKKIHHLATTVNRVPKYIY